jgi:hypothetical protein
VFFDLRLLWFSFILVHGAGCFTFIFCFLQKWNEKKETSEKFLDSKKLRQWGVSYVWPFEL